MWNCILWKHCLWIIYWEDCISLGPPLERWHAGAVVGLSRLCAQAASLRGQTAFCIFMAGFTTGKWSFPGLWRQWRGWSGTTEGPSAQHEVFKTATGSQFWEMELSIFPPLNQPARLPVTQVLLLHHIQTQIFKYVHVTVNQASRQPTVVAVVTFCSSSGLLQRAKQTLVYSSASGMLESDTATKYVGGHQSEWNSGITTVRGQLNAVYKEALLHNCVVWHCKEQYLCLYVEIWNFWWILQQIQSNILCRVLIPCARIVQSDNFDVNMLRTALGVAICWFIRKEQDCFMVLYDFLH